MKMVRWVLAGLAGFVAVVFVIVYAGATWRLAQTYDVPVMPVNVAAASVENGKRLAAIVGCIDCHKTGGGVVFSVPMVATMVAPNLSRLKDDYTDGELARLIRHGVKRDGTSALIMPVDEYAWLADDDLADIVAWVRSLKRVADDDPAASSYGPIGYWMALHGDVPYSVELAKEANATPLKQHPTGPQLVVGEYWAKAACLHCHRMDTEHEVRPGTMAPPLGPMAQSYDLEQFTRLLHAGKAIGDRDLDLMDDIARASFSSFSNEEIAAIHAYLTQETAAPAPTEKPAP